MNDDGAARAARQFELFGEDALLSISGGMVVVIIETDFAPGQEFWMLRQIAELVVMYKCGEPGFVRVNSGRGVDPVVALGKWHCRGQRSRSAANGQNLAHADRLRPREHVGSIRIEFGHVHVRMRIDELELHGLRSAVLHSRYST